MNGVAKRFISLAGAGTLALGLLVGGSAAANADTIACGSAGVKKIVYYPNGQIASIECYPPQKSTPRR